MIRSHAAHIYHHMPRLKTLLPNAPVTIIFDGLIYTAYNEKKRLYQAGIHTHAEGHHLIVEVRVDGKSEPIFPTNELPWDPSHETVAENAPFWLYIDTGQGRPVNQFRAELHKPDDLRDPQSFGHVLAFEGLYQRSLELDLSQLALFNFPDGTCYSAQNANAKLMQFEQGADARTATFVRSITVSALGAIDIANTGNRTPRWMVLENKDGKEFFRFPLSPSRHYEVKVMNIPSAENPVFNAEDHFLRFYDLFKLNADEKVFLVHAAEDMDTHPSSPPCVLSRSTINSGLSS